MSDNIEPPNCPYCDNPVKAPIYVVYEDYRWNKEKGTYVEDKYGSIAEIHCEHCGSDLVDDLFPNGVCNYERSKVNEKKKVS